MAGKHNWQVALNESFTTRRSHCPVDASQSPISDRLLGLTESGELNKKNILIETFFFSAGRLNVKTSLIIRSQLAVLSVSNKISNSDKIAVFDCQRSLFFSCEYEENYLNVFLVNALQLSDNKVLNVRL